MNLRQFVDMVKSQSLVKLNVANVWTIAPTWKRSEQLLSSETFKNYPNLLSYLL
jgi:hypothetical protein